MSSLEYKANRFQLGGDMCRIHEKCQFDTKARIIIEMITRFGLVAGVPPEGDTSSRLYALLPPKEVVTRSFEIADLMFSELDKRDHILHLPGISELQEIVDKEKD